MRRNRYLDLATHFPATLVAEMEASLPRGHAAHSWETAEDADDDAHLALLDEEAEDDGADPSDHAEEPNRYM